MKKFTIVFILIFIINSILFSQNNFKWDANQFINKDSSISLKPIMLVQLQAKYLELNSGTTNLVNQPLKNILDISVKRTCYGMSFNSPKFKSNLILGTGLVNSKSNYSIFLYEAWAGFVIKKNHIFGLGHNLYNGISRASSISASMILNSDLIVYAFPEAGKAALLGRHSSIFMSGNISRFGYRFNVSQPYTFAMPELSSEITNSIDFATNNLGYEGYFNIYFFDKEDNTTEAKSFSYLGTKKILNLGFGFFYRKNSSITQNQLLDKIFYDKKTYSIDLYSDIPLKNKDVFNSYFVYFNNNFGKNYIKSTGGINYLFGGTSLEKAGDNEFVSGTGQVFYLQISYLFNKNVFLKNYQLFVTYTHKDFELLKNKSNQLGIGFNYYLNSHKLKIGFEIQNRPCYKTDYTIEDYKYNAIFYLSFSL